VWGFFLVPSDDESDPSRNQEKSLLAGWCIINGTPVEEDVCRSMFPKYLYGFTAPEPAGSPCSSGCAASHAKIAAAFGRDLMRVELGWPIGMPLVRSLGEGLWEVRSQLPSRRTARLIVCFHLENIIVLHGFIKKTRSTPPEDLALAKRRMKEVKA